MLRPAGAGCGSRVPSRAEHITVRARTACRLAVLPREQLDSQALLGVGAEQTSRLNAIRAPEDA